MATTFNTHVMLNAGDTISAFDVKSFGSSIYSPGSMVATPIGTANGKDFYRVRFNLNTNTWNNGVNHTIVVTTTNGGMYNCEAEVGALNTLLTNSGVGRGVNIYTDEYFSSVNNISDTYSYIFILESANANDLLFTVPNALYPSGGVTTQANIVGFTNTSNTINPDGSVNVYTTIAKTFGQSSTNNYVSVRNNSSSNYIRFYRDYRVGRIYKTHIIVPTGKTISSFTTSSMLAGSFETELVGTANGNDFYRASFKTFASYATSSDYISMTVTLSGGGNYTANATVGGKTALQTASGAGASGICCTPSYFHTIDNFADTIYTTTLYGNKAAGTLLATLPCPTWANGYTTTTASEVGSNFDNTTRTIQGDGSVLLKNSSSRSVGDTFLANASNYIQLSASAGNSILYYPSITIAANSAPTTSPGNATSITGILANASGSIHELSTNFTEPNGEAITYSIVGGADAALFTINTTTGALSFASEPTAAGDYVVQVRGTDPNAAFANYTLTMGGRNAYY